MENTTYNTEKTLNFIHKMFIRQISDKTVKASDSVNNKKQKSNLKQQNTYNIKEDYVFLQFEIISEFDFLNRDNFRNEIEVYKQTGKINYINKTLDLARKNVELFNAKLEEKILNRKMKDEILIFDLKKETEISESERVMIEAYDLKKKLYFKKCDNYNFYDFCNYVISWITEDVLVNHKINTITDAGIELDLSDTKAKEKIIYLKELGIFDFLRTKQPFIQSTSRLATILSAITGEKYSTLQSYINPIVSPSVEQGNNPYNNKKTVEKVKKQIIHIGFPLE
jgi:hypothetical protein